MTQIEITIEGITPLICNRFTEAAERSVSQDSTSSLKGDKGTPREQAEPKCYRNKSAQFVIPGTNIFRSIIDAGKYLKNGKSKITTQKTSLIPSFSAMETIDAVICNGDKKPVKDFEVDSRSVVIPSTGGRIMAHRPRFDCWSCAFEIALDEKDCSSKLFRTLVDYAGSKVGLGDFRPDRKGPFGKFKVIHWKESVTKSE